MNREREPSDREIVQSVQDGNTDAFVMIIERYNERIFNMICRHTGYQEAVDLTQDVFLKVFKNIGSFKKASRFSTWLYRITLNTITSHRRKSSQVHFIHFYDGAHSERDESRSFFEPASSEPTPPEIVLRKEEILAVQNAINSLDEIDREIIILRDIEGVRYNEITEILNIPMGTVKSRLYRARTALREKLNILINMPEEGPEH